jgi:hypothetical protein
VPAPINGEAGESLKEANRRHGLEITAKTVERLWDGEHLDLDLAVSVLMACDDDRIDNEGHDSQVEERTRCQTVNPRDT